MAPMEIRRRDFLRSAAAAGSAAMLGGGPARADEALRAAKQAGGRLLGEKRYTGPNVVIVRFGGGVRRKETIVPETTYAPYLLKELAPQGVLFRDMEIAQLEGVETSHGQGTLYLLTGKYDEFKDVGGKFLGQRFEAKVPTLFEYLRGAYDIPTHRALIINGEDRTDEEFYSFSNHHLFGAQYRSSVLSLYRFKVHLLRKQVETGGFADHVMAEKREELAKLESLDYRTDNDRQSPAIEAFWDRWEAYYGESGLVNPRGDRLLTELALRAMGELRPRLMMINYNDPDYVHWGNPAHYTRGISIIDHELRRLVEYTRGDAFYRDNTLFVVVPDCGRDDNALIEVPFQHHFNTKSAHQVWALFHGPGVPKGVVIDRTVQQTSVAATVGGLMGFETPFTAEPALEEVWT